MSRAAARARRAALRPCPRAPNCVSTLARDRRHAVAPLVPAGTPAAAWAGLREVVASEPRARVVEAREGYLRAEIPTRLFGFVDELECVLALDEGVIHVRSGARRGYWDLGVNRRRVERIRRRLRERGVVE